VTAVAGDLYVRDGSRFVLYDSAAQHVPPIPVPVPVAMPEDLPEEPSWADPETPGRMLVRTFRCEHGHYSRPGGPGRGCRPCRR
jgi:hypothetical protein